MTLAGRSAIVTGSSTGLGYSIATALLKEGANIAVCGRDGAAVSEAASRLQQTAEHGQLIIAAQCDVADQAQVSDFVDRALSAFGSVEILVNNAGVLGPMGKSEDVDLAEWRATVDINLFGTLLCCRAVLPHFRASKYGKIINLSGGGGASPRPFFSAYATSKAAVVRLTENLAEELRGTGIDVNAIAPGALNTRMLAQTIAAGPDRVGETQFDQVLRQKQTGGSPLEKAAALCVYLAGDASNGITGKLISAPWDAWHSLHEHISELQTTDIYTLRRITPADRSKAWT